MNKLNTEELLRPIVQSSRPIVFPDPHVFVGAADIEIHILQQARGQCVIPELKETVLVSIKLVCAVLATSKSRLGVSFRFPVLFLDSVLASVAPPPREGIWAPFEAATFNISATE